MPIGRALTAAAKTASRAFNHALAEAGGSLPTWLILLSLKTGKPGNQRELARAVGIQGATLTHHLNAMESDGLITRERDPGNRRIHRVRLTERGETLFHTLAGAAREHDRQLRTGFGEEEIAQLASLLDRLARNVSADSVSEP